MCNLCVCVCVRSVTLVVSDSLRPQGLLPTRFLYPWEFSRQEYWSGWPCPPPGDLPNPRSEPQSPALQADNLLSEPPGEVKVVKKYKIPDIR